MRKTRLIAAVSAVSMLALVACADDDGGDSNSDDNGATVTTDSGLEVTGDPGKKPTVEVPAEKAPTELVVDVMEEGDGEEVKAGDWLVTDYLGQTWDTQGKEDPVFDNSWDRGQPVGFIIGAVDPSLTAEGSEVDDVDAGSPVVTSDKDGLPKVDFANAKQPKESKATVVIEGDGPKLGDGAVIHFAEATYADKKVTYRSWDDEAPQVMTEAGYAGIPGLGDALKDATVGSRIMVEISANDNPAQGGGKGEPIVLVVDVIGTYTTAA